jgi:hypothetical protein
MGVVITIAEPDLQVLAQQVPSIKPAMLLILAVALGVGVFFVIAVARTLFKIRLSVLLIISYVLVFAVAYFTPETFVPVAFDSGGVTTGPITVPFILAMGAGLTALRSDKDGSSDSFGYVALCSVGPILAVMLLGIFFKPSGGDVGSVETVAANTSREVFESFAFRLPHFSKEVSSALAAIVVFFLVFQFVSRRYNKHQIQRIAVGFVYTFIGLVIFLVGVNVGFIPVGRLLGTDLAASELKWVLIPLSMLIGYFIVAAEPAVHVLKKQVEDISAGSIPAKAMSTALSIGMAAALGLTMTRILLHIPIMYILVPGYATALILTFFVPRIFTGIAFDSGGVCSGPLTSTFLLPLAIGVCIGSGGDLMKEAFGIVSMVAMAPLVVIQILGLVYSSKLKTVNLAAVAGSRDTVVVSGEIIEYDVRAYYD